MAKIIFDIDVIGNSLISTERDSLTIQQLYQFLDFVDQLLPEGYYIFNNDDSFFNFCEEYSFLVKNIDDTMMIVCNKQELYKYFRTNLPSDLVAVFDKAGAKLNELEANMEENVTDVNDQEENTCAIEPVNVRTLKKRKGIFNKKFLK